MLLRQLAFNLARTEGLDGDKARLHKLGLRVEAGSLSIATKIDEMEQRQVRHEGIGLRDLYADRRRFAAVYISHVQYQLALHDLPSNVKAILARALSIGAKLLSAPDSDDGEPSGSKRLFKYVCVTRTKVWEPASNIAAFLL